MGASCYLTNVKNSVFRNLRWELRSSGDKEKFLGQVIIYCNKLLADPEEPRVKRRRVRNGSEIVTRR